MLSLMLWGRAIGWVLMAILLVRRADMFSLSEGGGALTLRDGGCAEGAATKFGRALGRKRDDSYPMGLAVRQYFRSPMESSTTSSARRA